MAAAVATAPLPAAPEPAFPSPWQAAGLSFLGTYLAVGAGFGQIATGDWQRGLVVCGLELPVGMAGVAAGLALGDALFPAPAVCPGNPSGYQLLTVLRPCPQPDGALSMLSVGMVTAVTLYGAWAAWDAYHLVERRALVMPAPRPSLEVTPGRPADDRLR